jgi:carbamoyl-phosphate synthase small subunit
LDDIVKDSLQAILLLQDGTLIRGRGFGFPCRVVGEVVFNTGMVGYTESLTDPSYKGQILCLTYPLVGNYGVPSYDSLDEFGLPRYFESDKIQTAGLIIHELCRRPSHWSSVKNIHEWLYSEGIPGIWDVDTRSLTKTIRTHGVMMGALEVSQGTVEIESLKRELDCSRSYNEINFVDQVSIESIKEYARSGPRVVLVDCGVKNGILRCLLQRNLSVVRVPYDIPAKDILSYLPTGIVLSNGPGDPKLCRSTIKVASELINEDIPFLGICLGNQILALAEGGDTFKLMYGHRGHNKPCVDLTTGKSYVTSQNHGFAVAPDALKETGLKPWFINADDKTIEGVKHLKKPCMAVQFHPEAFPGPYDTGFVFDVFENMVKRRF